MAKGITIAKLLESEAYKNNGRAFPHPADLLREFNEIVLRHSPTAELLVLMVDKQGGARTEDGTEIDTWGRGLIQYTLPSPDSDKASSIGLIWSYDTSKQAIKIFRGVNVFACTNYMVCGAEDIYERIFKKTGGKSEKEVAKAWSREIEDVMDAVSDKTEEYMENMLDYYNKSTALINSFKSSVYENRIIDEGKTTEHKEEVVDLSVSLPEITNLIGELYITNVICGEFDYSTFNEGCRLIFNDKHLHNNKSLYRLTDNKLTLWQLYNSFTQRLTDGKVDIDQLPNKTLEITNMLIPFIK